MKDFGGFCVGVLLVVVLILMGIGFLHIISENSISTFYVTPCERKYCVVASGSTKDSYIYGPTDLTDATKKADAYNKLLWEK